MPIESASSRPLLVRAIVYNRILPELLRLKRDGGLAGPREEAPEDADG